MFKLQQIIGKWVKPEYPSYPFSWDYETAEEYNTAKADYNKLKEEYSQKSELYRQKERRDQLRENLKVEKYSYGRYSLCYYNGSEVKVLYRTN